MCLSSQRYAGHLSAEAQHLLFHVLGAMPVFLRVPQAVGGAPALTYQALALRFAEPAMQLQAAVVVLLAALLQPVAQMMCRKVQLP